jgi:hypothetical protein
MKTYNTIFLVVAFTLLVVSIGSAQTVSHSQMPQVDCSKCHTCEVPTVKEPCLKSCPRTEMVHQTSKHGLGEAPDSMLLDQLANLYGPVQFNHKLHATMAEMGGECATCHHYSPKGHIPPCNDCHDAAAASTDLRKPNLKGAYHRQCLSCHREWSHDTKCVICHVPTQTSGFLSQSQDPTDIMGISHPKIIAPVTEVYRTPYEKAPIVTFQHKEHIELFGFRCVDCHKQENCGYCHDINKPSANKKSQEEVHAICNDCHKEDRCDKCHDTKQRPSFTHDATGWTLHPYHKNLDCRACHPTGKPIAKLDRACITCHGGWSQENFKHDRVGLALDETHREFDCEDCHESRQFTAAPTCSNCHDDDRAPREFPPGEYSGANTK